MSAIDPSKIREDCDTFLRRKGHGSTKILADAAKLTPETIRKVRNGTDVDLKTLQKVDRAMRGLGWYGEIPQRPAPRSGEIRAPYVSEFSALYIIGEEFVQIGRKLQSSDFKTVDKIKDLRAFVASLKESLDSKIEVIQKSANDRN